MMLLWLVLTPAIGGGLAWAVAGRGGGTARWMVLATLALDAALLWITVAASGPGGGRWLVEWRGAWIPRFGIGFHLGLDGLSLALVLLTLLLGAVAAVASWDEIRERQGFYYFNLLWTVAGVIGVFLAVDLFLFFVFWEAMLVPMYFLIALWGHEGRLRAAIKFFIFTQASGLLMLSAIIALVLFHHGQSGVYSFDYMDLLGQHIAPSAAFWIMLGFFVAFAVKLPVFPFHSWLPDAHTEAPTGGSVLLAGILLKTGAYGLLRFVIPLFPVASAQFAPVAMGLGLIGIVYGAVVAFAQSDLKRLIAYTSISHMGFVLVGAFAAEALAVRGALMEMVAHGISTGALFMIAGALQQRLGTRDMDRMGGLWGSVPRIGAVGLFFVVASFGLPGLANFVGEFLVLLGVFRSHAVVAVLGASALVLSAAYGLILVQRTFHGPGEGRAVPDFGGLEMAAMGVMVVLLLWLGLFPQPLFDVTGTVLDRVLVVTTG